MRLQQLFAVVALCVVASLPRTTEAGFIAADSASGTGTFNNSPGLIIDGVIPAEFTVWTASTNVWWNGLSPTFTVDLGNVYLVEDVVVSVDNNDSYRVRYSTDNVSFSTLFEISGGHGEVTTGMDTMSTISGDPEYIGALDFSPVNARYLQIFATGGDNSYSIGELQAHGTAVPEPSSLALLGLGGLGLLGFRRRRPRDAAGTVRPA